MLLDLQKAGKISDSTYKMLDSSDGLCPRFYGLPKIHKPGIPLRPIDPKEFSDLCNFWLSCENFDACCWEY